MLHDFLQTNKNEILRMTEAKSLRLAGLRPSSGELKNGLPIFYDQLMDVLDKEQSEPQGDEDSPSDAEVKGEAMLSKTAALHGKELMRLGYTLSHAVHAYGAMCQSITELATRKMEPITADEFHDLNRCLDVAIAGAVTEFQSHTNTKEMKREVEHLGFLAHELRNALMSVNISLQMIRKGTVGFGGSTGRVLDMNLKRMEVLINESMTKVRLQVDPKVRSELIVVRQMVDQILLTAQFEAAQKKQTLSVSIDPALEIMADTQLMYSAVSNLIQNAIKYSKVGTTIQIRSGLSEQNFFLEVEDECGGLSDDKANLFKPFEQKDKNRSGMGLGLTIAQTAITLNEGKIELKNLPGKGCVFSIKLPMSFISRA